MADGHALTAQAEREIARVTNISDAIEMAEHEALGVAETLIAALADHNCFRIHRDWSASAERKLATQAAAKALVRAILTNDWCDLPSEVVHLHVERAQ